MFVLDIQGWLAMFLVFSSTETPNGLVKHFEPGVVPDFC